MAEIQRIRHKPGTVLDQVETRNRVWNSAILDWEVATTEVQQNIDPTAGYKISDIDDSGNPAYYGYVNALGAWYIMENNTVNKTYRYVSGSSGYAAAWAVKTGKVYVLFNEAF